MNNLWNSLKKALNRSSRSQHTSGADAEHSDVTSRMAQRQQHRTKRNPQSPDENALPPFSRETLWLYIDTGLQTMRGLIVAVVVGLIVLGSLGLGLGLGYFASIIDKTPVPTPTALRRSINNADNSATMYYAGNVKLGDVRSDLVRKTVPLNQMSPWVQKAIVATEDEDFFKHSGVMPKSLIRAVLSSVTGMGGQTGGSTLTQQLVKMQLLSSETTFKRKAQEIMLARRVDRYMSKQAVLNAYLNVATLGRNNKGQNIAGVEAAAEGLFGTTAAKLNIAQAAFIAGLPQSPFGYTPYTTSGKLGDLKPGLARQRTVLFRMYRSGYINQQQYDQAKAYDIKTHLLPQDHVQASKDSSDYAYNAVLSQAESIIAKQLAKRDDVSTSDLNADANLYSQYLVQASSLLRTKGYQIHSTLIRPVYQQMQTTMENYKRTFGTAHTYSYTDPNTGEEKTTTEPAENGTVLLDNHTGAILGFVGGVKPGVNHIYTTRSPGSTIKPILVYGPAVQNKLIGSNTMLADFKTNFKSYSVTDYGGVIQNKFIPASKALAESYNIPAINLYNAVRKKINVKAHMRKLGINTLTNNDYSQLGLGLGGTDYGVTLDAQASAFSTFANQGKHVTSYMISDITDPTGKIIYKHKVHGKQVFSKGTTYIMNKMLKGVVSDGTATSLTGTLNFNSNKLIGKTGTSNDYRDIWFIGSTPGVTLASWMGYDNNYGQTFDMSSSGSAINQRYWAAQMNQIYSLIPNRLKLNEQLHRPSTVKSVLVNAQTGMPNGTVTHNGTPITTSGNTVESLYDDWTPGHVTNQFGIGGSTSDYNLFWDHLLGISNNYGVETGGDGLSSTTSSQTTNDNTDGANGNTTTASSSSSSFSMPSFNFSSSSSYSAPAASSSSVASSASSIPEASASSTSPAEGTATEKP